MHVAEYLTLALATESLPSTDTWRGAMPRQAWRLNHAALGLASECADLALALNHRPAAIAPHLIVEELGDCAWYWALA
ncbi:MAG: nucleoside triphosphate pyrophosphohydrolase family protein [Planctomycetota bacterium]|jgi:hypothetical protein